MIPWRLFVLLLVLLLPGGSLLLLAAATAKALRAGRNRLAEARAVPARACAGPGA